MPSDKREFPSDAWIPAIRNLCLEFQKHLYNRPGGEYLVFNDYLGTAEKPGKIVKEYHRTARLLKQKLFEEKANREHIDYHKIAALYIRSFLKYKPFVLDIPKGIKRGKKCLYTKLANEYFVIPF